MTIRKSIKVEQPPPVAFRVFCQEIGQWWPLQQGFSFGGERAKDIFIEGRIGGRFYERFADGTEFEVGRVIDYQPPAMVAFTWPHRDGRGRPASKCGTWRTVLEPMSNWSIADGLKVQKCLTTAIDTRTDGISYWASFNRELLPEDEGRVSK
jgi:uncharacterized protein YndB with AHSA1/START domain